MRNGCTNPLRDLFDSTMSASVTTLRPIFDKLKSDRISSAIPHSSFLIPYSSFYLSVVAFLTMELISALSSSAVRPERICSERS